MRGRKKEIERKKIERKKLKERNWKTILSYRNWMIKIKIQVSYLTWPALNDYLWTLGDMTFSLL